LTSSEYDLVSPYIGHYYEWLE